MPAYTNDQIYASLKELGVIDENKLTQAYRDATTQKIDLYDILSDRDLISDENFGKLVSDMLGVPYADLTNIPLSPDALKLVSDRFVENNLVVPFRIADGVLHLALADPRNFQTISALEKKSGLRVKVFYSTKRDVRDALAIYKKGLRTAFDDLDRRKSTTKRKQGSSSLSIDQILRLLVDNAYDLRASDIHVDPLEDKSVIRFRIDGVLKDVLDFPHDLHEQLINKVKIEAKLRTDEHASAQDGKMIFKLKDEELDIRVSIVPVVNGENCVMRLLSSRSRQFGLLDLGFSQEDLEKVKRAFSKPYGMILSTGPTGSGKTTTIYSILKILNTRERNIASIEDPVEYEIEGINQIQVNPKSNLTFTAGLRSILRQDPDIIYVGEIRDPETADIAVNSAMTGHLVLSTLHTNDSATALPRLIDMGIEPFLVASTVNIIVAQRLVRRICNECKISKSIKASEFYSHFRNLPHHDSVTKAKNIRIYEGKGCAVCANTGYLGRAGIFEVLEVNEAVRNLIVSKAPSDRINAQAVKSGMTTMLSDGIDKVLKGVTTLDEVLRVTSE